MSKYPIAAALQARTAHPTAAKKRPALALLSVTCTFLSQTYCAAMVTCSYGPNDTGPHGMAIYATKLGANILTTSHIIRALVRSIRAVEPHCLPAHLRTNHYPSPGTSSPTGCQPLSANNSALRKVPPRHLAPNKESTVSRNLRCFSLLPSRI